jgi:hypothetical protein
VPQTPRLLLRFEWMKPMVEKFLSDAALDMAMLNSLMATICS